MGEIAQLVRAVKSAFGGKARKPANLRPYKDSENFSGFELSFPPEPAALLKAELGRARAVLEYGSGGSTFLGLQSGVEIIFSVESDGDWAARIRAELAKKFEPSRFIIHHADIGPTGPWGFPSDKSGAARYPAYAAGPYDMPGFRQPDLVIIDGRFRAACFTTAMLRCTQPVRVVFDDYFNRPEYQWVEAFFKPVQRAGRMALFEVEPRPFPTDYLSKLLAAYVDSD